MADARIFFSNPHIPKTLGSLVVTAWETESHNRSNTITDYPVETGVEISDHIQNLPIELSVKGIIEAVEMGDNILDAFTTLENIMINKQLITVVTGLKVYDNMGILSFSVDRNALNGGSLSFNAELKQVFAVSSQSISIPNNILSDNNKQADANQNIGKTTSGQSQESEEGGNFLAQIDAQLDQIFGVVAQ